MKQWKKTEKCLRGFRPYCKQLLPLLVQFLAALLKFIPSLLAGLFTNSKK